MKTQITAIATVMLLVPFVGAVYAESVPDWIKSNAAWWAQGAISESEFISGLQYLIEENVLKVPPTQLSQETSDAVPEWFKTNAGWWADGIISDGEFVDGVQHLMEIGIISVSSSVQPEQTPVVEESSEVQKLQAELEACQEITRAYKRLNCERDVENQILFIDYKISSQVIQVGPVTFYYPGADLEIMSTGQPLLTIKMMVENTGSSDNVSLFCSGPSVCNYDLTDGQKTYKYSSTNFTNGNIVLKPGQFREMEIMFGPNIGYGGTTFEYDPSKQYTFRISEPWGNYNLPLTLD